MSQSVELTSCRYLDPDRDQRLPYVYFDPSQKYELPCEGVVNEITNFNEGVTPENASALVPLKGCLKQRELELCPRGLPLAVPDELKP